jgi:hypothetical protein
MRDESQTTQLKYDVSSMFGETEENRVKCQSGLPLSMLGIKSEIT